MRTDFIEAASLEIHRFVPPALLPDDIGKLDLEDFIRLLARARYIEEIEEDIVARAISKVFSD
ncbi:hypothetical protein [Ruminiclostridium papyrosolvens]|uniref:Uncharacterized protein n=1 Tax=Ruminiclostridium papyrosolvens C7 TaxID=1330534 RepID=U4QXX6_9FIRM|nr:hypothetical protein [Ruminiclostridium papyrosolvens]EPR07762.1 hypothetical protein L323_19875 [Ruminiclostridium papyrosolvens C7]